MSARGESWKAALLAKGGPKADEFRRKRAAAARRQRRARAAKAGRPYSDIWLDRVEIERWAQKRTVRAAARATEGRSEHQLIQRLADEGRGCYPTERSEVILNGTL